jgi:hypothetical protein
VSFVQLYLRRTLVLSDLMEAMVQLTLAGIQKNVAANNKGCFTATFMLVVRYCLVNIKVVTFYIGAIKIGGYKTAAIYINIIKV